MNRLRMLLVLVLSGLIPAGLVLAQTSPNFQNTNSGVIPIIIDANSSNFSIDGSVEPIVGSTNSPSFGLDTGSQANPGTTPTPPPPPPPSGGSGGGGGGGGGVPLPVETETGTGLGEPTILLDKLWTYKSSKTLSGSKTSDTAFVLLNGSANSVTYPNATTWERLIPLALGNNDVYLQATASGTASNVVHVIIRRRLIGDVNDSQYVDDIDLSMFTRHWKAFDRQSDFNEDGIIDDVDLSLLASHWNQRF